MLFRLTSSVTGLLRSKTPPQAQSKGIPELLADLARVRARKADLEREEQGILSATQAKLREQHEALEELKRQVKECGIVSDASPAPFAPSATAPESVAQEPALVSN
jgi:hypothetical protein